MMLCWAVLPEALTPKVVGNACNTRELGVVAKNSILTWLDGPPATLALMTAEPAWFELIVTSAVSPFTVIALGALNVPRVVKKLTVRPFGTGRPDSSQCTVTGWGVFSGTSASGSGAVKAKLAELTDRVAVPVAPRANAWTVSVPGTVAVTVTVAWPVESVVTVVALRVFPSVELKVTCLYWIPFPAESRSRRDSRVVPLNTRALAPLIVSVVPVT